MKYRRRRKIRRNVEHYATHNLCGTTSKQGTVSGVLVGSGFDLEYDHSDIRDPKKERLPP